MHIQFKYDIERELRDRGEMMRAISKERMELDNSGTREERACNVT